MARQLTKLPVPALFLCLQAWHALSLPMTTWTPFDLKIDDAPAGKMPFSHESIIAMCSSPSMGIPASIEMPAEGATSMPAAYAVPNPLYRFQQGTDTHSRPTASFDSLRSSPAFNAFSSIAHYIPESPLPNNILIVFQLISGATAALCLILGLASCISRLEDRRLRQNRFTSDDPQHRQLSRLEIDVREDLQTLVVKTRSLSTRHPQSPGKSALFSPDRKGSLGKNVSWADEVAESSAEEDLSTSKGFEDCSGRIGQRL